MTKLFHQNILPQILYISRIASLLWSASRWYTVAWLVILIIQGLMPAALIFLTRHLVDNLVEVIGAGISWETARPVAIYGGLMAGILVLTEILGSIMEWVRTAQSEYFRDHINSLVHEKSASLDLGFYESADFHDRLDRARSEANDRSLALLESGGSLLQNTITLVAMASMLIPYGLWVPLVLLASTLPALFIVIRFNRRYHRWWEQTTPERRWTNYYDWLLTFSGIAAELRLFGLGDKFRSNYQSLRRDLREQNLKLIRQQNVARFAAGLTALLIGGAAMAWMIWRAFLGSVTLGELVLFYQAFNKGQTLMRTLLGNVGQIYSNSLFIGNLIEFLDLQPNVTDQENPLAVPASTKKSLSFKDVSFRYSGSDKYALQNFSLTIPAGNTVAIMGANGAGKSTLLKLICRFYDPASGRVELDGVDIRNLPIDELRRQITVVFQYPVPYHATAAENISLGDVESLPNAAEIEAAARNAGAHEFISRLANGYDTLLGKWFANGTELSGGEWQRLALARAFVRQAPIIVLDEPTSFMDSWAEIEWMERFRELAKGRTAIIVTHRLTTAMRADAIHVMEDGHIIESGTHDELVELDGHYAKSWTAQTNVEAEVTEIVSSPFVQNIGRPTAS